MQAQQRKVFEMVPIGRVRRDDDAVVLEIDAPFRPALKQLGHFSHVMVFWWADQFDNDEFRTMLQTEPPYAQGHMTGVFATRAPYRPNPVAMTTCPIVGVDEEAGLVTVSNLDAFDGTRIVDLKAYFPVCDRVQDAHIPDWLADWPEWMPEAGIDLEEYEK
jgi:tRNA-Thr(GGU) m(6)t(6)A37 methyltransferase TsaA